MKDNIYKVDFIVIEIVCSHIDIGKRMKIPTRENISNHLPNKGNAQNEILLQCVLIARTKIK